MLSPSHALGPDTTLTSLSDFALRARSTDPGVLDELAARHASSLALIDHLSPHGSLSVDWGALTAGDLPVRAAHLSRHGSLAGGPVTVDEWLVENFRSLTPVWQAALWHVDVEGESLQEASRVCGVADDYMPALVRLARQRLLTSVIEATPNGTSASCADLLLVVFAWDGGDPQLVADAAAAHGRGCDMCMLLIRRVLASTTGLRMSLTQAFAGDLGRRYVENRPRPWRWSATAMSASTRRRGEAAVATVGAMGVTAVAVFSLMVAPSIVSPYLPLPGPRAAAVTPGAVVSQAAGGDTGQTSVEAAPRSVAGPTPRQMDEISGEADEVGSGTGDQTDTSTDPAVDGGAPTPGTPSAEEPVDPTGPPPSASPDPDTPPVSPDPDGQASPPSPSPSVSAGPVTVGGSDGSPTIEVGGEEMVPEEPSLPDLPPAAPGLPDLPLPSVPSSPVAPVGVGPGLAVGAGQGNAPLAHR